MRAEAATTQDKILDKLAKLKRQAESEAKIGNVAAAEAFAQALNAMLLRHELSMEDVPTGQREDDPIVEQMVDPKRHGLKFGRSRVGWQETLASIVARAHLCKIIVHPGTNYVTFVGTRSHVEVAEYAYGVLAGAADRMSMEARVEWWKREHGGAHVKSGNYRASWLTGFVLRIQERLRETRAAEVAQANQLALAAGAGSTALMRLDGALARVTDYMGKYKSRASAVNLGMGNGDAFRDGRRAADQMNIGQRGVKGAANKQIGGR